MISFTYESLFRQDSVDKQISITGTDIALTNADIFQGSFEINESLNTGEDLAFGSFVSSCMKFTTSAIESSFIGKTLTVKLVIGGHTNKPLSIGTYKVVEEKWTANRTKKEITAYDMLYDVVNKEVSTWYNSLTFPITVKNFRNSFFSYVGITQSSTTLINDSIQIYRSIEPTQLSGSEVLRAILELNGCFGRMKRNNLFEYKTLSDVSVYSITPSMYTECKYEDYTVNAIDKVIIRKEENDIGGEAGQGNNALIIQGNFLVYGNETSVTTIATNILNSVSVISYVPTEISVIGNPCVEVGDLVTITKKDGTSFNTYVLSRKWTNIQSIKDEYTATGNPNRINDLNTINNEWLQLLGKTNILNRTIDETISQVGELGNAVTTIRQDTDSIELQVQSLQEQLDGDTAYYERHGEPTKLNYPYWDFTRGIPCNNTIILDEIYTDKMQEGGDKYPHFTYYDEDLKNYMRALCVDLDNGNGYRFVQENGVWTWKLIADSNFSYLYNRIAELEISIDGIETNVSDIEVDMSNLDERITTNTTNITQTSNSISAEITRATTVEENLTTSVNANAQGLNDEIARATGVEANLSANITATASSIITQVSATYQPISAMSNYQPVSAMSNYWTISQTSTAIEQTASTITQSVATTYATKTQLADYQTVSGMSVYCTLEEADSKIGQSASSITAYVSGNYQLISAMANYPTTSAMTNYVDGELSDYSTTSAIANLYYNKLQTDALLSITTSTITLEVSQNYQPISAMSNYYDIDTADSRFYTNTDAQILIGNVSDIQDDITDMNDPTKSGSLANQITAKVSKNSPSGQTNFSWEMTDSKMEWKQNGNRIMLLNSSGLELTGKITATSGYIGSTSGFNIGSTSIYNGVTSMSDTSHNGIYLGTDGINLGQGKFKVTNAGALNATNATITGSITATSGYIGSSSGFSINSTNIHNGVTSLSDTSHDGIYIGTDGITLGKGVFKVTKTGELTATSGKLATWRLNTYGMTCEHPLFPNDYFNLGFDRSVAPYRNYELTSNQKLTISSTTGLDFSVGTACLVSGNIINKTGNQNVSIVAGDHKLILEVNGTYWRCYVDGDGLSRLGDSNYRWGTIYSTSGTINTSDRNEKEKIIELNSKITDFVLKLKPVSYKFKVGKRTHFGLIAQDVEETMTELGMTDMDFGGLCKDKKENSDEYTYGLRYEEFIAPLIKVVQMQQKEIEELKKKVGEWTNR